MTRASRSLVRTGTRPVDLRHATTADLARLLDLLEREEVRNPPSGLSLAGCGLAELKACGFEDQHPQAVIAAISAVLQERASAPKTQLGLVWSGPDSTRSRTRSTSVVVRELFRKARKSVLLGACYITDGENIFKQLHTVMRDHGVQATMCLDLNPNSKGHSSHSPQSQARKAAQEFLRQNWPFGSPLPKLYYDPRSFDPDAQSLLHAKCVVVDGRISLVTSANFTRSGQKRNLEVGVQIENEHFSQHLEAQFQSLISSGELVHCPIESDEVWHSSKVHRDSDWDEVLEDLDEDYRELAQALANAGLRAPDNYDSDLTIADRVTGCLSILDWQGSEETISLVREQDRAELNPASESWIFVTPQSDPKTVLSSLEPKILHMKVE